MGWSRARVEHFLNFDCGLQAMTKIKKVNMRKLIKAAKQGNREAQQALAVYVYRIRKYIGAYHAVLGQVDALIFTGAIGFGSSLIRRQITRGLVVLKKTPVLAIKTDEEQQIAQDAQELLARCRTRWR